MLAALLGEFEQLLIQGRNGSTGRLNWFYPKMSLGSVTILLSQQKQVRSNYPKSQGWKSAEEESGPLHTSCNLRCYLFFFCSFRSRAARVSSHVSSWLHRAQAKRQSSKGKSKVGSAPHCKQVRDHFWEPGTCP